MATPPRITTRQNLDAAIDQACRRLRWPTIRAVVDEATTAAQKEQLTYQRVLAELQPPTHGYSGPGRKI
jgi:hypothetical protein